MEKDSAKGSLGLDYLRDTKFDREDKNSGLGDQFDAGPGTFCPANYLRCTESDREDKKVKSDPAQTRRFLSSDALSVHGR